MEPVGRKKQGKGVGRKPGGSARRAADRPRRGTPQAKPLAREGGWEELSSAVLVDSLVGVVLGAGLRDCSHSRRQLSAASEGRLEASEDGPCVLSVQCQRHPLQSLNSTGGLELARRQNGSLGKLSPYLSCLWAPSSSASIDDHGDERHPFVLTLRFRV